MLYNLDNTFWKVLVWNTPYQKINETNQLIGKEVFWVYETQLDPFQPHKYFVIRILYKVTCQIMNRMLFVIIFSTLIIYLYWQCLYKILFRVKPTRFYPYQIMFWLVNQPTRPVNFATPSDKRVLSPFIRLNLI